MTEIQEGTAARYCKPATLDKQTQYPESSAFQLRIINGIQEKYLSFYLLDFFARATEHENVIETKNTMEQNGFKLKGSGVFALLDIKQSKEYIFEQIVETISYKELNLPHCGLFHDYADLVMSEYLVQSTRTCYIIKSL